ncbi:MFS transporter [Kibdelosporangium philippinense]|uniref:MFS transporter n=2 Tax=Kibdelosporangium philippinense TaxID=211113 RepID=A0ABS8ZYG1_9PSEU|nr:MFS transporter [Kibdelosporangium philippinense]MCE7011157.1 MFS transporter [Kibdelosporangium philippinense]
MMDGLPKVDIGKVIDGSRWSALQKLVIGMCFGLALLEGYDLQAMAYTASSVAREFGLGPGALSFVFSSGLVGMFLGSGIFGLTADRFGRRIVLVVGALVFGVGTLLVAVVGNSVETLAILRFLAGIGLGGTISTQLAMAAEYAPARARSTVVMLLVGAVGLGASVGGLVAAVVIPAFGWRMIFAIGGVLPLLLAVWMARGLPDSIRFLLAAGRADEARDLLRRVAPDAVADGPVDLVSPTDHTGRSPVASLFTEGRALGTVLVWIAYFMNLVSVYFLLSWLPVLFQQAGLSASTATVATSTFAAGGIFGGFLLGRLIDRDEHGRTHRFLVLGYLIAAACAVVASVTTQQPPLLFIAVFLAGFGVGGSQGGVSAAAASMYPTAARATGVGWATGVGRIGSILGPTLGGSLLAAGLAATSIIAVAAVPMALAAVAVAPLGMAARRRTS